MSQHELHNNICLRCGLSLSRILKEARNIIKQRYNCNDVQEYIRLHQDKISEIAPLYENCLTDDELIVKSIIK
jgi:hypothetical protein